MPPAIVPSHRHLADLSGFEFGHYLSGCILDAGYIGQQQQSIRLQGRRDGSGSGIAVHVEGFTVFACSERRNHGDYIMREKIMQ